LLTHLSRFGASVSTRPLCNMIMPHLLCVYPKDTRLREATSDSSCPHPAALAHVLSFHGHSLSRAHFRHSRCPPHAAAVHGALALVPRTNNHCHGPLQALEMPAHRRRHGPRLLVPRLLVPQASVDAGLLQALEMPPPAAMVHVLSFHGQSLSRPTSGTRDARPPPHWRTLTRFSAEPL